MFQDRRFRPSWLMTIATVAFVALTVSLGNWQRGRAVEKETLQARLDSASNEAPRAVPGVEAKAEDFALRPVVAEGSFEERYGILLDNKVYQGRAGYHVATPLRLRGGDTYVLVLRGWAPGGRTREDLPEVSAPEGAQRIAGLAVVPSERILELATDEHPGRVWQNLVIERYRAWSGLKLQPFVIEQSNDTGDGLVRDWPRPDFGIEKHRSYMLQWYSLSILTVVLYVVLNFKRKRGAD